MTQEEYHVIVLGSGIGGLACAGLLAQRGLKVIVLEPSAMPGGCSSTIERDGYHFGLGASVVWGLHEGGPLYHVLNELSCLNEVVHDHRNAQAQELPLQVILPYHRLNVYADRSRLIEEVDRELGEDGEMVRKFYNSFKALSGVMDDLQVGYPFHGITNNGTRSTLLRRALAGALKDCQRELGFIFDTQRLRPETRGFLAAQARFFGATPLSPGALLYVAALTRVPELGVYAFRGGGLGLANLLADRVRAFGGSVIYKADIEEILFKGSRAVGVQARLDGGSSTLTADTVVVNLGYEVLFNHLIKEPRGLGRLRKELGSASRRWLAASLLLGVEDAVIPEPLAGQAIVIPDETQEPAGENLILLTVSPAWDEGRAPLGKRALTVTTYLPAPNGGLTDLPHIDEAFVERLQRRLGRILPFLSTSIDLREIFQPEHYLHTVLRSADDLIRIEGLPQYMGMSGLPLKFAFRNLLFVGADSFLGPNAAGSVMSGWLAANVITS